MWRGNRSDWCSYTSSIAMLPAVNEIFRINRYGTIKQRLTNNEHFEGELAVSPDFQRVAFTSNRDGNYDLYMADLDDMDTLRQITNSRGYQGDVQFAPDGRSIAFAAWRPRSPEGGELFEWLRSFNVTDKSRMEVYLLDVETEEETKISRFGDSSSLPELNNTWERPYFAFAPNGDLYIRQHIQFYRLNRSSTLLEPAELKLFPNDKQFFDFQLRSGDDIFINSYTNNRDQSTGMSLYMGKFNASATYDIRIPQIPQ
ncbi:CRE-TAG-10 protein [Aphelenchoides fujianensis]|nr:CRE-TAG-10 protein [Aphelenchoides fujianensis]